MMVLSNPDLEKAEQQVLAILKRQTSPYSPVALLRELRDHQISEALARAAIWYLIDRYEIELTWDRQLQMAPREVAQVR
jgi:hypothetical protein